MTDIHDLGRISHLQNHLKSFSQHDLIPANHQNYLMELKQGGFEPKVIYDIGSNVLHWTHAARKLWPDATYILFDAFQPAEFLYVEDGSLYNIGALSNTDGNVVKFYQNDYCPGGNSYYKEIGSFEHEQYFPENNFIEMITQTLDSVVKNRGFPLPDFIKMDVQGCEVDILKGGLETIKHAKRLIVELQHSNYNRGAPVVTESLPFIESLGWKCDSHAFQNNGPDADYSFVNLQN
jgi:FkbM family methyltransferase